MGTADTAPVVPKPMLFRFLAHRLMPKLTSKGSLRAMHNDQVFTDFFADFADECARQLRAAGYSVPSPTDHEGIIRSYLNVHRRRVSIRPRRVHKATYSVPTHLVDGEREFLAKVMSGDDLRPYQSTLLDQSDFNDGMLDDFGIQHFHLGTTKHPKNPSFVARKNPLLFALVRDEEFFCIGYYSHGEWSKKELLDIVHLHWPRTISSYELVGVQSTNQYTDEEHQRMRKADINVATTRPDGTIHIGPGGGITTAGTSIRDTLALNNLNRLCSALTSETIREVENLANSKFVSLPVHPKLRFRDDGAYIDVDGKNTIKVKPSITVPPL